MSDPPAPRRAQAIRRYLTGHRDQMCALLEALVRAESPTDVPEAQAAPQAILTRVLRTLDVRPLVLPGGPERAGPLYARPSARSPGASAQLLLGHSDTDWPRGTLDEMPFRVDDGRAYGPGAFDAKAGLVQMVFALAALRATDTPLPATPVLLVSADAVQGSPAARRHVRRLARCACRAFAVGPALGRNGAIIEARKGDGRFTVHIEGRSAHAGLDPESGASAIRELSSVVQRLHALNDLAAGVSVDVHTIDGGTRPNVVAGESVAEVEVRVAKPEQGAQVEQAIRSLKATTEGTSLTIEGGMRRPPMEPTNATRHLVGQAREIAGRLDVDLNTGRAATASDANIAAQHTPTLDGLGAVGDKGPSRREFCVVDRMVERSALLALLLAQPIHDTQPSRRAETASSVRS